MELTRRAHQRSNLADTIRFQGRALKQSAILDRIEQAVSSSEDRTSKLQEVIISLNWEDSTLKKYGKWVEDFRSKTGLSVPLSSLMLPMLLEYVTGIIALGNLSGALQAISAISHFWRLKTGVNLW